MKRFLIMLVCVAMLLSSCGQQNNSTQYNISSQDNESTSEPDGEQMRQVLIKTTEYDENDNVLGWIEYSYDTENQCEWHKYDSDGKLLGRGIVKYDDNWNLIEDLEYNVYDILIEEYKYNENGDIIYRADYTENGTLEHKGNWTYNDDGTENSCTYIHSNPDGDYRVVNKTIYNEEGVPLRIETELSSGERFNSELYRYDENNRIIEEIGYNPDGQKSSRTTYQYDEFGSINNTEETIYIDEANYYKILCQYDEFGNCIDKQYIFPLAPEYNFSVTDTYDENGHCLTTKISHPSSPEDDSLITSIYDENGFLLRQDYKEYEKSWYYSYEYEMIPVSGK